MATQLDFITQVSTTGVAFLNTGQIFSAEYDNYFINLELASSSTYNEIYMTDSSNNKLTTAKYDQAMLVMKSDASFTEHRDTGASVGWREFGAYIDNEDEGYGMSFYLFNPFKDDNEKIESFKQLQKDIKDILKDYCDDTISSKRIDHRLVLFIGCLESYYDDIISTIKSDYNNDLRVYIQKYHEEYGVPLDVIVETLKVANTFNITYPIGVQERVKKNFYPRDIWGTAMAVFEERYCNSATDGEKFLDDILRSNGIQVCSLCGSPLTNKFHTPHDDDKNIQKIDEMLGVI